MFEKLGRLAVRRSKLVLVTFVISMLAAGGIGLSVFGNLDSGGYSDPNSESMKVWNYFKENLKTRDAGVILVVDGKANSVNNPQVVSDALTLEKEVAAIPGVKSTLSYWSSGNQPTLVSKDGNAAYLLIYTKSDDFAEVGKLGKEIQSKFDGEYKSLHVYASGNGVITSAINGRISKDLALAESISIPLTFILLIVVFGAIVASAMPLFVGLFSILGAFFLLYLLTKFTAVSVFALNLVTGIGLGLGIDYSLLMVNRFREELHHGKEVADAVITTVKTAGKTVFYSGLTVAVTLGSMVVFHTSYTGKTISDMKASFNVDIGKLSTTKDVWFRDASFVDASGTATFTEEETKEITRVLSQAGSLFQQINPLALNRISASETILMQIKTFNNSKVREGQAIKNTTAHTNELIKTIETKLNQSVLEAKLEKTKKERIAKKNEIMRFYRSNASELKKIFDLQNLLVDAKLMIVRKLESIRDVGTFIRTDNGFRITAPEGFVAVDRIKGNAMKLIDRLEFAHANFNAAKNWSK